MKIQSTIFKLIYARVFRGRCKYNKYPKKRTKNRRKRIIGAYLRSKGGRSPRAPRAGWDAPTGAAHGARAAQRAG